MRRLRHPRPAGCRPPHVLRSLCPAAPWPGSGGHRPVQGTATSWRCATRGSSTRSFRRAEAWNDSRGLGRSAMCATRRPAQHVKNAQPFVVDGPRPNRRRSQWQPRQRGTTAGGTGSQGFDLSNHRRQRDHPSLARATARFGRRSFRVASHRGRVLHRAHGRARDPWLSRSLRFRPLCIGKKDGAYVLSSESCALDLIQAEYVREVEPGEVVIIDNSGIRSEWPFPSTRRAFCIFEYVYFARPIARFPESMSAKLESRWAASSRASIPSKRTS